MPASQNPTDAYWGGVSPNATKAAHITRIKTALANKEAAEAGQEGEVETGVRDFAAGVSGTVGKFASGAGKLLHFAPLADVGNRLSQNAEAVAPTAENEGRNQIGANIGSDIGEAAPQFAAGEVAGVGARPITAAFRSVVPALRPQLGPALAEGTSKIGQAFKAGASALPGNLAANTALQGTTDPEHPITPVSAGLSVLGAVGEAAGTSARIGKSPTVRSAPEVFPLSAPDLAAIQRLRETQKPENGALNAADNRPIGDVSAKTTRRPAGEPANPVQPAPIDKPVSTADARLAVGQASKIIEANMVTPNPNPAPASAEAFPDGYSTKSTATTRRPAAEPGVEPAPSAPTEPPFAPRTLTGPETETTADPNGYVARTMEVGRRRQATLDAGGVETPPDLAPALAREGRQAETVPADATAEPPIATTAPQQGPLRTRAQIDAGLGEDQAIPPTRIGESVSAGRDLNAPSRIPDGAPRIRVPRGSEPEGTVQTPEGAVSAGPPESAKAIATRAALKAFAPESPEAVAFSKALDRVFPEPSESAEPRAGSRTIPGETPPQTPEAAQQGEGKNVPASRLLNTEKLGLTSTAQDATVRADLDRLKSAGLDRERVGLDQQTAQAKANIGDRLKFMLTDLDPAKAEKLSGAEIGQLYEHLSNNAAQRTALSQEMSKPGTTAARVQEIGTLMDGLEKDADALAGNIVKGTAQKGRDLNYLRQIAQQSTDPGVWLAQAKRALGDRPLDDETQSLITKLANDAKSACGV